MTDRERLSVNKRTLKAIAAGLAVLLCLLMLAGCASMNEAEKKVYKELKALQESDSTGSEVITLRDSLSEEGRKNFDGFLKKLSVYGNSQPYAVFAVSSSMYQILLIPYTGSCLRYSVSPLTAKDRSAEQITMIIANIEMKRPERRFLLSRLI